MLSGEPVWFEVSQELYQYCELAVGHVHIARAPGVDGRRRRAKPLGKLIQSEVPLGDLESA